MISICIPTYNYPEIFKKCLDSIAMQSFQDFEIIVSDDSENDAVKSLVASYHFKNIKYFKNEKRLGSPSNWNNALNHAKGKYVKMMHHDDYFTHKDSLLRFVAAQEKNPEAAFFFSYTNIHFSKQGDYFIHKQTPNQVKRLGREPEFLFFRNVVGAPSATFFKNDPAIQFNPAYKWLVDVEFYIRYLKTHKNFVVIPEALVTVVDGAAGQISQDVADNKQIVVSEHLNLFSSLYSEKLDTKKASLFFQELFVRFEIFTFEQLEQQFAVPDKILPFLKYAFKDLTRNTFVKAIKKRLLTSRYNKQIFKIERF